MKIESLNNEEFAKKLERVGNGANAICAAAVFKGAGHIADQYTSEVEQLPVGHDQHHVSDKITETQKRDLSSSIGIQKFESSDFVTQTKITFHGYGSAPTKAYPLGLPNKELARSIESGTSFRKKNPFIRRMVNRERALTQQIMSNAADKKIKELKGE